MKLTHLILVTAAFTLPATAHAQFGGLGKRMLGGGNASTVAPQDADAFLGNAMRSTRNVMISAALLAQVITDRNGLAGQKAEITALQNAQDVKELDAHKAQLTSNLDVLNKRADLAGDLTTVYESGNAQQKKLIAIAVSNLALGVYRNVQLSGQAPDMVRNVGSNPQMLSRVGQFKLAAGLIGLQAKGLGGIATAMPRLLSAVKVKAPAQAETTEPQLVSL